MRLSRSFSILLAWLTAAFLLLPRLSSASPPIPGEVRDALVFIYVDDPHRGIAANGTGFLVGVPNPSEPSTFFLSIVTAGHVLRCDQTGPPYDHVFLRLNLRKGGTQFARVPLLTRGKDATVFFHPDPTVDVAVIPVALDDAVVDFKFLPDEALAQAWEFSEPSFREGAEVFFAGLFVHYIPSARNVPIVRFGRVALGPPQEVPWGSLLSELLLIESSSYGGNSGSPVFFYLGSERYAGSLMAGPPLLRVAGLISGAYNDIRPVQALTAMSISTSNMGISGVVPAYKIYELLNFGDPARARAIRNGP